jgi:hypothetical protein
MLTPGYEKREGASGPRAPSIKAVRSVLSGLLVAVSQHGDFHDPLQCSVETRRAVLHLCDNQKFYVLDCQAVKIQVPMVDPEARRAHSKDGERFAIVQRDRRALQSVSTAVT